jgi:hypothetical protein
MMLALSGDVFLEHHQHFVEGRVADLLVALARLLRLGADQPRILENLHVGRNRRLRQCECRRDVVDVQRPLDVQQLQDLDARLGGEPLQHINPLLGVDDKEIAAHVYPELRRRGLRLSVPAIHIRGSGPFTTPFRAVRSTSPI